MSPAADILKPGQIARVRQRTYLVEQIVKPKRAADSTLVKLSCVDDDNQGQPLEILWEKELDPHVLTAESWGTIASKGFDDSNLFAAYLNTLKWNCVTSTDPKLFQSPFRAGIRLDALLDEYRQTREERLKNETKRAPISSSGEMGRLPMFPRMISRSGLGSPTRGRNRRNAQITRRTRASGMARLREVAGDSAPGQLMRRKF